MPKAQKKGFALLSKEARVEMARKGGKAAQKSGKVNRFTSETAKKASLKAKRLAKAAKKTVKKAVKKVTKKRK